MLGTLTAVPIKVPHVSSLHRLAGQAATVLPQVSPRQLTPEGQLHVLLFHLHGEHGVLLLLFYLLKAAD